MLRNVKEFAPRILIDGFKEMFYIRWSAGRSPRVHEVNPGWDPSETFVHSMTIVQKQRWYTKITLKINPDFKSTFIALIDS